MIFFDCERFRYPNSGLFTFCSELGKALVENYGNEAADKLGFYVQKGYEGYFGSGLTYMTRNSLQKYLLWSHKMELWHSTYQLTRYMPAATKRIQTIHDLNYLYEDIPQRMKSTYEKRIRKHTKGLSHIVAISEFTKNDILSHFDIGDTPISVVYNGCNTYNGTLQEPRNKPERPFLLTVSSVVEKKNQHVLPPLLNVCDFDLIIAGNTAGNEKYAKKIQAEADKAGVGDRVKLVGTVSEAEKHWYLKNCSAFLFPSIAEGFGLPVIEAMQYGKPVFLSRHTCLTEIGGDYAYYFDYDFDRREMQREFIDGMADFGRGSKTPESVKAHAHSFSWREAARKYKRIYEQVLQG